MIFPYKFNKALKKDRIKRALNKAEVLNDRVAQFIKDIDTDLSLSDREKSKIKKRLFKDFK